MSLNTWILNFGGVCAGAFFVADIVAVEAVVLLDSGHQNAGFVFVSVVRHARSKSGPRIYLLAISNKNISRCNFFRCAAEGDAKQCRAEYSNEWNVMKCNDCNV